MTDTLQFTIGRLAKQANVNIETIRYYQRVGLIQKPKKPKQGYRIYPTEYILRIKFIKRAQELGFTLKEIEDLLDLGDGNCKQVQHLAEQKLAQIEKRVKDLKAIKKALNSLIKQCQTQSENIHCALIDSLSEEQGSG